VGHAVELAGERGMRAMGVEINPVALQVATAHGRRVYHTKDLEQHTTFHLVSMFEALEHVTAPDEVLAIAARRLAPGGILLVTVPNRAAWEISVLRQRSFHVFGGFEGVGHINLFDEHSLSRLFQRHGLRMLFSDGQFSNNPFDVLDAFLRTDRSGADVVAEAQLQLDIPAPAHRILNSIGPYIAILDRLTGRSPILLALACRAADAESHAGLVERLEAQRRNEILSALG
jgi:SAM-dependent methyltransferase